MLLQLLQLNKLPRLMESNAFQPKQTEDREDKWSEEKKRSVYIFRWQES